MASQINHFTETVVLEAASEKPPKNHRLPASSPCSPSALRRHLHLSLGRQVSVMTMRGTQVPPRDPHLIGLGYGLSIGVVERCPSDKTMLPKLNAAVLGGGGGLVSNSCLTLATPWSLLSSPVHGILQARILEWVAIPFSRGSS